MQHKEVEKKNLIKNYIVSTNKGLCDPTEKDVFSA